MVLAGVRSNFEHRWDDAETLCGRALKVQPGLAGAYTVWGMALLCQGNIQGAESSLRRSLELDPLSAGNCARIAYLHYVKGDHRSASDYLKQSFDLDRDFPEARFYEGLLHFQRRDYDSVVQCLSSSSVPLDIGLIAAAHARNGNLPLAEECLEQLVRSSSKHYVTPLAEGLVAIGTGDLDRAFHCINEATDHMTNFVNMLEVEPFFNPLRNDGRFAKLLKRLNLSR
jgi:serine/threonine-protein kinase